MVSPKVSVIIPAHNEENYIRQTLHSIKNQNFQDFEVIVVANGCNDKTEEIVKRRVNEKVKLLSLPKPNVSRARNHGASKATGEILVFLDADTTLDLDSLQSINRDFLSELAVATTRVKPDKADFRFKAAMVFKNFYNKGLYKGCSGALVCRREDFDKVNGYDHNIVVKEHRDLTKRLEEIGKYKCLNTNVTTSMRRLKQWGLSRSTFFWVKQFFVDKFGDLKKSDYERIR